jgi:hypothetical protein
MDHFTHKHPVVCHPHTMQNLHGHLVLCFISKAFIKSAHFRRYVTTQNLPGQCSLCSDQLLAGQLRNSGSISSRGKKFFLLQSIQTAAHPAPYSKALSWRVQQYNMKLATDLLLVQSLGMSESIHPLPHIPSQSTHTQFQINVSLYHRLSTVYIKHVLPQHLTLKLTIGSCHTGESESSWHT